MIFEIYQYLWLTKSLHYPEVEIMNKIITYFYFEDTNKVGGYSNVRFKNYFKHNETYMRCILNFFVSSKKFNSNSDFYFITNRPIESINYIKNFDFKEFFKKNNIKFIYKESKFVNPKQEKWAGSMYLFDAIEYFYKNNEKTCKYFFFDNDVLIHGNLDNLGFDDYHYAYYNISEEYIKNGVWLTDFNGINKQYLKYKNFKPVGGEFLYLRGDFLDSFFEKFLSIFPKDGFLTEEHYLSYLFSYLIDGAKGIEVNDSLKRIWLTFKHNNLEKKDINLQILHLPSEKNIWFTLA